MESTSINVLIDIDSMLYELVKFSSRDGGGMRSKRGDGVGLIRNRNSD